MLTYKLLNDNYILRENINQKIQEYIDNLKILVQKNELLYNFTSLKEDPRILDNIKSIKNAMIQNRPMFNGHGCRSKKTNYYNVILYDYYFFEYEKYITCKGRKKLVYKIIDNFPDALINIINDYIPEIEVIISIRYFGYSDPALYQTQFIRKIHCLEFGYISIYPLDSKNIIINFDTHNSNINGLSFNFNNFLCYISRPRKNMSVDLKLFNCLLIETEKVPQFIKHLENIMVNYDCQNFANFMSHEIIFNNREHNKESSWPKEIFHGGLDPYGEEIVEYLKLDKNKKYWIGIDIWDSIIEKTVICIKLDHIQDIIYELNIMNEQIAELQQNNIPLYCKF